MERKTQGQYRNAEQIKRPSQFACWSTWAVLPAIVVVTSLSFCARPLRTTECRAALHTLVERATNPSSERMTEILGQRRRSDETRCNDTQNNNNGNGNDSGDDEQPQQHSKVTVCSAATW